MKCYNCGFEILDSVNVECPKCAMKFPVKCGSCNAYNGLYAKHCSTCGESLEAFGNSTLKNFETLTESRKNVAVIFADISGFTALSERMDPEEVRDIVNGCFDYITKPVYELEGTIDKYIGDCVMILFGAKYSHVDDASRAVTCALRMMDLIKEYSRERLYDQGISLELSIGVNYGLVVTGRVGNTYDSDFTVMGDTVNTSQRLQSAAEVGHILVSDICYEETKDRFKYSEVKEIKVKNKEKPLKCYNAIEGLKTSDIDNAFLIEREEALAFIKDRFDNLEGDRYVSIVGESGIGKTQLIKVFSKVVEEKALVPIWVNCYNVYKGKAYYTIASLLYALTKIQEEESMLLKKSKLYAYVKFLFRDKGQERLDRNYNFLTLVMGIEKSEAFNDVLKSMMYEDVVREVDLQLGIFFSMIYEVQNSLIIIDDLQWADQVSLNILEKLAKNCQHNASFYMFAAHHDFKGLMGTTNRIDLNKLSIKGIQSFIRREFACTLVDEKLIQRILEDSKGNPLFVKEYLHALKRSNKYRLEEGFLSVDDKYLSTVPKNIENIILNNLSDLSDDEFEFLQIASCIGKEFNDYWVGELLPKNVDYETLGRQLSEHQILTLEDVHTSNGVLNRTYLFAQDTVRNVLYKSILNKKKIAYYQRISELIERLYKEELEPYYEGLYKYYEGAQGWNKAADYAYLTAVKQKKAFNFHDALTYYNRFITHTQRESDTSTDGRLTQVFKDMGTINNTLGASEKAIEYLEKGIQSSQVQEEIYTIKLMVVEIYKDIAKFDEGAAIIAEIETKIRENSNVYGRLLMLKCSLLYHKRDRRLVDIALKSLEVLSKTRDDENLGQMESLLGLYYFVSGKGDDALYYFNKAYGHIEQSGNLRLQSRIAGNLGIIYHQSGRISKALDYFNKSQNLAKKISDVKMNISNNINLGVLYMDKGLFARAHSLFEEALEQSRELSLDYQQCMALRNLGDVSYEEGDLLRTMSLYDEALIIAKNHNMKADEGALYANMAKVKIKEHRLDEANDLLDKGFVILNEIDEVAELTDVYRFRSLIQLEENKHEEALENCENSIKFAVESEDDGKRMKALLQKGQILLAMAHLEEAIECYNASLKLGIQLESEYESTKAYYHRAMVYKILNQEELQQKDLAKVGELLKSVDACEWKSYVLGQMH